MKILACDWATKKALQVYDSQEDKVRSIPNSIPEFEKYLKKLDCKNTTLLFEFGGGDTFKIMAFRSGCRILQVPGKKIRDFREGLGLEKTDEGDAKLIYDFYVREGAVGIMDKIPGDTLPLPDSKNPDPHGSTKNNGEGAGSRMNNNSVDPLPFSDKTNGGSAKVPVEKVLIAPLPPSFSLFTEQYADIAEVKILFREHEDLKKNMVREKNRKIAFERKFEIAHVAGKRIKIMLMHKDGAIVAKENELKVLKKILEEKVSSFYVWENYLKGLKGVGPMIAAGLIGELGGRQFDTSESLKNYSGMIPRKESKSYNRYIKAVLFQFAESIIKRRTPKWREMYDSMKEYYRKKHEDWGPGKVNAFAMKFVETKFLLTFWKEWNKQEEEKV